MVSSNIKHRKCLACGSEYSYCPNCDKDKDKPTWMFVFDTERCKSVFELLEAYGRGEFTKEQMKQELAKFELTTDYISSLTASMQGQLIEINTTETVATVSKKKPKTTEAIAAE